MWDWRNAKGGGGESLVHCPSDATKASFKAAAQAGDIFWHAFPHNAMPGLYDESLFNASLDMGFHLADAMGVPRPRAYSQRDESGITRAALPLLVKNNISIISLGSGAPLFAMPDLFVWRCTLP